MAFHHRLIVGAARLYWRVFKPRTLGVRAIVLDQHDRIALVRHTYADPWFLPGGGVKKGESFPAALARELSEETGLATFTIDRMAGAYHSRRDDRDDYVILFVVRVEAAADARLHPADAFEIAEARWFPLDALPDGLSPASHRRILESCHGMVGTGQW